MMKPRIADEVAPNLVPMVDIMFLLLLFFMLSADMGQRELEDVKLPRAVSAQSDVLADGGPKRLVINISHGTDLRCSACSLYLLRCGEASHWRWSIWGQDFRDDRELENYLRERARAWPAPGGLSSLRVMIRADERAFYGLAQKAMALCANAGIHKVEIGTAMDPQSR